MGLFHREKTPRYDPQTQQPAVRKSYCNREMAFGFLDRESGRFREYGCATTQAELEAFCRQYGISPEDLKTIY